LFICLFMIQSLTKMNLSSLRSGCVALCGVFGFDIHEFLTSLNILIVPWSSHLSALICGSGYEDKIKYKSALANGTKCIQWSEFEALIPRQLWTDQYAPQSVRDIIGHNDVVRVLGDWLAKWNTSREDERGALISGPPGIGKTTLVHLVTRSAGYEIIEMNASDCRSASQIKALFETAVRSHVVGGRRVVIMDEVDGMSSGDRGGVGELAAMIRISSFPIICIANDRSKPKMKPIVKACLDLKCSRPTKTTIARAIYERIVKPRHLTLNPVDLERMCEAGGNDIRQIVNSLQFGAAGEACEAGLAGAAGGSSKDNILRMDPFSAAGLLFKTPSDPDLDKRMNYVYLDHGLVPLMVAEGYLGAAGRPGAAGLDGIVRASQALEMYDILDARIHRNQAWSLLPAAVMGVVEAAGAVHGPAPFQIFPQWLGKSSKARKHKRWMAELGRRLGVSVGNMIDVREVLRLKLFGLKDATAIVDALIELGITRDDMFEVLSETVFTGDEKTVAMETKLKGAVTREWKKRGISEDSVAINDVDSDSEIDNED
jgi:replication factor C subunit 1